MVDAVLFDARRDGIAVITLNRPAARNALGKEIRKSLFAAWERFESDATLRVAILTGAGDVFCAGGDLKEMVETRLTVPPRDMFPVPGENISLSKPTIAAVNGAAFAGGFMIAQACDLCVASTSAKFAITEVRVGRSSPWAAPLIHMLPQRSGPSVEGSLALLSPVPPRTDPRRTGGTPASFHSSPPPR